MDDYFDELEKEHEKHRQRDALDMGRMREDWFALFTTPLGMRVFGDMLILSDYFGMRFTGNSKQFFLEGMRFFVSNIIQIAGWDTPDGLHRILQIQTATQQRRNENGG